MKRLLLIAGLMLLFAALATAQTTPVTYVDDFQSYGKSKKPDGWIDGKVGDLAAKPRGYYKTAIDPTQDNKGTNIVFGTTKSVGSEDDEKHGRIGYFSTYVTKTFAAAGRFEIQGRVIEMSPIGRFGLVLLSGYPDKDNYYLIGEKRDAAGNVRLQAMAYGAGSLTGSTEASDAIQRGQWYRFRVSADDVNNVTTIRARFWLDGTPEPPTYQIEATDSSASRLKSGHFGLWSGGRGDADDGSTDDDGSKGLYIDDLNAHSPSDTTPPVIAFYESGVKLDPTTTPAFNHDARIEIRVTDDLSTFTYTAQLDGSPYVSLTPVSAEGLHTLTVHAVDAPGNARDATLKFLVDKTKPVITLLANGSPLTSGAIFNADVTLSANVQDISAVKVTATLDGAAVTLPLPVAQEGAHTISVTAVDAAGNSNTASAPFTVDKSAPVIAIQANGSTLVDGTSFREDVTLTWTATDLTLDTVTATLDNAPIQSGAVVTTESVHVLVVTATDKAGHTTTETRHFALDKHAPEVSLLANGAPFQPGKTYNTAVKFTVVVQDATPTTTAITVDQSNYTEGTPVTGDGTHNVKVVVTNSSGISTTVGPSDFVIDTVAPVVTMTESGQPFPDGAKFSRDVLPIVAATDNLTSSPAIVVTLDGKPYPANTVINEEKADHVISATATDAGGNIGSIGPFHFMLDKSKPVVTIVDAGSGQPFPPDALFNVPVRVRVTVADISKTTINATLDGAAFDLGAPSPQSDGSIVFTPAAISTEAAHVLSVVAMDEVGLSNDPAVAAFTIDMTPPHITFTEPVPDSTVGTLTVTVSGMADDAKTIVIEGQPADVNAASKTFTVAGIPLLEGRNEIHAVAIDAAGNRSTPSFFVTLDTRSPDVAIVSPAADACIDAASLDVHGTTGDPHIATVQVTIGAASVAATVDTAAGTWSASVPVAGEGRTLITVDAADALGHTTSVSRTVSIDRTAPVIAITEGGAPFTKTAVNRAVSLFIRVADTDPNVAVSAKLDGNAYVSGTPIATEGSHTLAVSATDCAGHNASKSVTFVVDLTAPGIRNLNPANGATVGATPASISGSTDSDAVSVQISGTSLSAVPAADGTFTIASVPFAEGSNHFTLIATDAAGNSGTVDYAVTVKTGAPAVEIRESGNPIADGSLFNRTVTPVIRSSDSSATITATLDGNSFTSGTTISADGAHKLTGTATDSFGHSSNATVNFTVDRTAPVVTITAPAAGTIQSDHVQVTGNAGDAVSATVNGQPVTLGTGGTFVLDSLPLDVGANEIVATGRDAAGNVGRASVTVTRDDLGAGVLITYPPDHSLTNRPTTDVVGRLLTVGRGTTVTLGTTAVTIDPTGEFRVSGYALKEGENAITVTSTAANGVQSSATTHVTADFTPPSLTILESGQPLVDNSRFPTQAVISLQSSDTAGAVTNTLTIDGTNVTATPFTITTAGGHSVVAVARDLAGNETRADRTVYIGSAGGGTAGCQLDTFDPPDGAVILTNSTTLVGRSGGAIGVKVNGVAATVADGAFIATVELPAEGANPVNITCTDAAGAPTGTPVTITLQRVTGDPTITITSPDENFASAQDTVAVSGTIGAGVVSADVNGVAATITGSTFTVPAVRLAPGLNILVAHGRNAAGRTGTASRRGIYYKDAPSISISAPTDGTNTGTPSITVSGTYTNVDPTTIAVGVTSAQFVRFSDTTGSFTINGVALTSGANTITVTGRDRLNRAATASVGVNLVVGTPSISISAPADHAYFGAGSTTVTVNGTFQAAAGSTVDVNGVAATLSGSTYSASAPFSTLAGGITPIVARVTEPGGASAASAITVTQLTAAPTVLESFPAPSAVEVDAGAMLLVLFSQPMDVATMSGVRLEDANGTPVSGTMYLDKDVLTFAPATLLASGGHYTLRVTTAAKNLAGTALAAEYTSAFTVAAAAPTTAPTLAPISAAVCGQSITISGTATPGARVRLDSGTLTLNGAADASGNFSFTYPLSGQSGFALVRVSTVGSDGSLSPAAELNIRIDCSGPQVLNASFDRSANKITIQFSEPVDTASVTVGTGNAILLSLDDGSSVAGTASVSGSLVTITPAQDLSAKGVSLTVTTAIKDLIGNPLTAAYTQSFPITGGQPTAGDGTGFISGEVYDATTGRPLAAAAVTIDLGTNAVSTTADARGRYVARLPEGAHTIKASLSGYTSVWRQIIVPAGAGVVPIDIRLTKRGDPTTSNGSAISLTHGGDTTVTKKVDLTVPAGALSNGSAISLTAVGAQALTGLLPLGWSPLASAEIAVNGADTSAALSGAQLTFNINAADVTAANQNLTAVAYDPVRDEWRVLIAVANVGSDGKVVVPIAASGAYALVYADKASGLTVPPLPAAGDVLRGVPAAPDNAPSLVKRDFTLNPPIILPTGRAVATLRIEGATNAFPSGTAVQAYVDEELTLADGSRLLDPPFATDLLLYRTLAGDLGVADFHLGPSAKAAEVVLETGVDHVHIQPYPGRLDRGTLIGSEGGRVPADDKVAIDIASGAVPEPLRATATSMTGTDLAAIGTIAGFRVVGGFRLTLQRVTEPAPIDLDGDGKPDPVAPVELFVPATAAFTVDASKMPSPSSPVILAEVLDQTPYGQMLRLADPMAPVDPTQLSTPAIRFITKTIDRSVLPVDGIVREGSYVVLAAEAPIAYATGTVHLLSATGRLISDARVTAPPLGVLELSRGNGIYNIPVPATPAAPFTLIPRHTSTGDGAAFVNPAAPAAGAVVHVDLSIVPQPPVLTSVTVLQGDPPSQGTLINGSVTANVAITTNVRAAFSPSIDPASVTADSITVTDSNGTKVSGSTSADGTVAAVWTLPAGQTLKPNGAYTVAVTPAIRGTNGATLGKGAVYNFTTVTQIVNSDIHPEKIRITIPDSSGVSRISGDPGALPAGWQAVAVRRNHDFIVRYQTTVATDGSFAFFIGNGGDPADKVTIADLIDLQVVNTNGAMAGIFALTPFVTADGKGFVVPAGAAIRYTTPEGITLNVPEGAFDVATIITVAAAKKDDFLDIPSLEAENEYVGSVKIDFDGTAKKPLAVELPIPAGFDTTGKQFILAQKGMSLRGPRLAVIDLLKVANGKLVTDDGSGTTLTAYKLGGPHAMSTLTGSKARKYLTLLLASGLFMAVDIKVPVGGAVGWAVMEGMQVGYDLTWSIFASYYIPAFQIVERGGALLPVLMGKAFTVYGTDPGTGLQAFSRTYDPIPIGPPGTVVPIEPAQQNDGGPYPVFGAPFRVEMLDLDVEKVTITSVRNFNVRLDGGSVTVTPGTASLSASTQVELMNVSNGGFTSGSAASALVLSAKLGDRIVLLVEERDVDPNVPISVVFNEPIYVGDSTDPDDIDNVLHGQIKVEQAAEPVPGGMPAYIDVTAEARFEMDSGNRRVNVVMPSALQRDAVYRVTLQPGIADVFKNAAGLKLGQGTTDNNGTLTPTGGGNPLHLTFHVRKAAGALASFTAAAGGIIHGMDLSGNVLMLALDGGLLSYDMSNPASAPAQLGYVPGTPDTAVSHWSVTIDRHNRVYSTAQLPIAGMFRSYRVEDFLGGGSSIPIKGSSLISWKLGYSQMIGLPSNTVISDMPESIPFRIKVALQDDETPFDNRQQFIAGTGAAKVADYPDDVQSFTVSIARGGDYRTQRITIENLTLDMRWSADATDSAAVFTNVIARSGDKLRLIKNLKTFAIVAHLGYGIAVYDANAIESNRVAGLTQSSPGHLQEKLILTAGKIPTDCPNATPDWGIIEGYLPTDVELRGDESGTLYSFSTDPYRGVLGLELELPSPDSAGTRDDTCEQRGQPNTGGLLFRSTPQGHEPDHIQQFYSAFVAAAGREPWNRFQALDQYHWSISATDNAKGLRGTFKGQKADRDYLLVAGFEYGLIVVETNSNPSIIQPFPLIDDNIADIIWIPGGATSVRVYQSANVAVVSDRYGRVVLVDLSHIDERWNDDGSKITGLFPSVKKALAGASADGLGVGADDPRIIWKSEPGVVSGSMAPVFDPVTGMVYAGSNVDRTVKTLSAIDPTLRVRVNLGNPNGLSDVSGIVPLGIAPPSDVQSQIDQAKPCDGTTIFCRENASLGVFRLEVGLPGNMLDSLTGSNNELQLAVEDERVVGAITEQTPAGFPRAHLRRMRRDGTAEAGNRVATNFRLKRIVPDALAPALKNQRGYNRFTSPWIVAIADPRASANYNWNGASTQQKKDAGCDACDRPQYLQNAGESDGVYELWTNGRFIAVRPELRSPGLTIFDGTTYGYLGQQRLIGRFSTIMADTVRPTDAVVAAQNPDVADGMLQETTFVHSGEVQSATVDLDAGGRAGFNVLFGRTYRSRTIGGTVFGQGWDSALLRRLRALPNGDVEYRDGAELWRFQATPSGYVAPKGVFLKLTRTQRGWKMVDQKWRISEFDDLGRIIFESDEFYDPQKPDSGNIIRYVYDDSGRLSTIVDPVQRTSALSYWSESEAGAAGAYPGLLKHVADWRNRALDFNYDAATGTLLKVSLPDVPTTDGNRPAVAYTYMPAAGSYSDQIELRSNLLSITDPHEVASAGAARVQFTYIASGSDRDKVASQQWGTGESASFTYSGPTSVSVTDVLGQARQYTLTQPPKDYVSDRPHVLSLVEKAVSTASAAFGELPGSISALVPSRSSADRTYNFTYDGEGLVAAASLNGVRSMTYGYKNVQPEAAGFVPTTTATTSQGGSSDTITQNVQYQSGANSDTRPQSYDSNGKTVSSPELHRNNLSSSAINDALTLLATCNSQGLAQEIQSRGGTDQAGGGATVSNTYAPANDAAPHRRSMPTQVSRGGLVTAIQYPTQDQVVERDERGLVKTTDYDALRRELHANVSGPDVTQDERYEYDASGRLRKSTRKQNGADVTTTYDYDVMGRQTSVTMDNVSSGGTVTVATQYDLNNHTIKTTHPGGAITTTTLDTLGRVESESTETGSSPIKDFFAYDLDNNLVFHTDLHDATAMAYDGHGRLVGTLTIDGTRTTVKSDSWGHPTDITETDAGGNTTAQSTFEYTDGGRLKSVDKRIDGSQTLHMQYTWDGGGRDTGESEGNRARHAQYDDAGRLQSAQRGEGDAQSVSTSFETTQASAHDGTLPQKLKKSEKNGGAYDLAVQYNTLSQETSRSLGNLQWEKHYDEDGNEISSQEPNRGTSTYEYDSRGAMKRQTLPGGGTNTYDYHATGMQTGYTDPSSEHTEIVPDLIGRPTKRIYADGTQEIIEWDGRRVKSITDRQGRIQTFGYNDKGQIATISGASGTVLDQLEYDAAGRLSRWTNKDAAIEYGNFNLDGKPQHTVQKRLSGGNVVDQYGQDHQWNTHGDRTHWTMPSYSGLTTSAPWTQAIDQDTDAMGNIIQMRRTPFGGSASGTLLDADYRNSGRPDRRTVTTASGHSIVRNYTYDSSNGLLSQTSMTVDGLVVAGAKITWDGLQRTVEQILGVSGGARTNQWGYDARSRLQTSALGIDNGLAPATDTLTPGDFRTALNRTGSTPADPPSLSFTELPGHKIGAMQRGATSEQFVFNGGERVQDGRYSYQYDEKGRLTTVTERSATAMSLRRILYFYDGRDRVVGRRAEYAQLSQAGATPAAADWKLEDRQPVLDADALPAETTFVWDAVSDRLVSIFKSGASEQSGIDANGGLLRQIIHGGLGLDDPIEVTVAGTTAASGVVHFYPIYDEAGAGVLQTVVNENGEIISRSVPGGSYGEDQAALNGPAIDKMAVNVTKAADGSVSNVDVTIRSTESIAPATLATGFRLAAVTSSGAVVRTSNKTPVLDGDAAAKWSFTATEWNALVDPTPVTVSGTTLTPAALSLAATSSLRASGWNASSSVMPAPAWAVATRPVYTSSALPIEARESLSTLSQLVASTPTGGQSSTTPYSVPGLIAIGVPRQAAPDPARVIVAAPFHAHPFQEPMTGGDYVRARWFDPQSGAWLTPDPSGYADSPNLYAYAGGDPVNHRDPTGQYEADVHYGLTKFLALQAGFNADDAETIAYFAERPDQVLATDPIVTTIRVGVNFAKAALEIVTTRNPAAGTAEFAEAEQLKSCLNLLHFPRGDRDHNVVVPNSTDAQRLSKIGVESGDLAIFGLGLHPLEDSYAHSGEPSLFGISGHPESQGGFSEHRADQPQRRRLLVLQAAESTYFYMLNYRRQNSRSYAHPAEYWGTVAQQVAEFSRLENIPQKREWLKQHGVDFDAAGHGKYWEDVTPGPSDTAGLSWWQRTKSKYWDSWYGPYQNVKKYNQEKQH